jgi:Domain of unknown function (DUF4832)
MNYRNQSMAAFYFATCLVVLGISSCTSPDGDSVTVSPRESDQLLVNPGMGFTTFYSFNGDSINSNHPECSIAYFRFYWDDLEPQDGKPAFAMLDSLLALAHRRGQKLALRVMCQNGHEMADKRGNDYREVPGWYREIASGFLYPDSVHWQPDYDDPLFLEKHGRLIRALGGRYDGHPDIDHVDIGSVGHWGEWHSTVGPLPSADTWRALIDIYLASFSQTPLVMNIDGDEALAYAVASGTGWRADCLGDMRSTAADRDWDHMSVAYPQAIEKHRLGGVWRNAPVVFETCWNMGHWQQQGWDENWILSKALEWHISVLNNKSFGIPDQYMSVVRELQLKMGYRFVLTRLTHKSKTTAGETLALEMDWINRGVAPCYVIHPLAFELVPSSGSGPSHRVLTDVDITRWLPGRRVVYSEIILPDDLPPGKYKLRMALLDPHRLQPAIRLAIKTDEDNGWYELSRIVVE